MTEDMKRSFKVLWRWFRYPNDGKTLDERMYGLNNFFKFWFFSMRLSEVKKSQFLKDFPNCHWAHTSIGHQDYPNTDHGYYLGKQTEIIAGEVWQLNSAYAWCRNKWMYREDKAEGWTIPTKMQRFLAYFDFRRT